MLEGEVWEWQADGKVLGVKVCGKGGCGKERCRGKEMCG